MVKILKHIFKWIKQDIQAIFNLNRLTLFENNVIIWYKKRDNISLIKRKTKWQQQQIFHSMVLTK